MTNPKEANIKRSQPPIIQSAHYSKNTSDTGASSSTSKSLRTKATSDTGHCQSYPKLYRTLQSSTDQRSQMVTQAKIPFKLVPVVPLRTHN